MAVINPGTTTSSSPLVTLSSTWTFVAGTTGAVAAHVLFTCTGRVLVDLFAAFCSSTLTSGGTPAITAGTASFVATLLTAPTGGAPGIVTNDWWTAAATPQLVSGPVTLFAGGQQVTARGQLVAENIVLDIPTSTVTGGVMDFYVSYRPLSAGASLAVTTPA